MRRALTIDEKSFGEDHPRCGHTRLSNLALLAPGDEPSVRGGAVDASSAEQLMRRALVRIIPRVAIRLNNLAHLLQATNRLSEAEPLMRRALSN